MLVDECKSAALEEKSSTISNLRPWSSIANNIAVKTSCGTCVRDGKNNVRRKYEKSDTNDRHLPLWSVTGPLVAVNILVIMSIYYTNTWRH